MNNLTLQKRISDAGLKVTPQRLAVLEAVISMNNHPSADIVYDHIHLKNPNVSLATVYKVLDILVRKGLLRKVTTEDDIMRYDAKLSDHHHIYFTDSDRIEDYHDEALTKKLYNYFKRHAIPGLQIEDLKLHIHGKQMKKAKK